MRRLRLSLAASILTVVFTVSTAIAGQMPTGVTSPPPPPPENSITGDMPGPGVTSSSLSTEASVTGDMPLGVTTALDPVTQFTLYLWQGVLSLF